MRRADSSERWMFQTLAVIIAVIVAAGAFFFMFGSLNVDTSDPNTAAYTKTNDTDTIEKYNFIIILADDLGWADVSWNNENVKTPNLDRIRKQGRTFTNLYAHATCSPSRAALMTGIYAWRLGLDGSPFHAGRVNGIPLNVPFLPAQLKQQNYSTHYIGKWHGGFCNERLIPTNRGFDTFYGFYSGAINYLSHDSKVGANISGLDYREVKGQNETILYSKNGVYTTRDFTEKALEKIDNFGENGNLLIVSYNAPHYPYILPSNFTDVYGNDTNMPPLRRNYLNTIYEMDLGIGRIYDSIVDNNHWNNTVFIFASDNGATNEGGSNYPLRGIKGDLFDGGNRIPGFIASPMFVETHGNFNKLAHFTDLMVTIQELAGIKRKGQDGINLLPALLGHANFEARKQLIYHIDTANKPAQEVKTNNHLQQLLRQSAFLSESKITYSFAIRYKNYKYIKSVHNIRTNLYPYRVFNNRWRWTAPYKWNSSHNIDDQYSMPCKIGIYDHWLFNLVEDPMESVNLLSDDFRSYEHSDIVEDIQSIMKEERIDMIEAQRSERSFRHIPEGAIVNGTWRTGWCSDDDLLKNNLFYNLHRQEMY